MQMNQGSNEEAFYLKEMDALKSLEAKYPNANRELFDQRRKELEEAKKIHEKLTNECEENLNIYRNEIYIRKEAIKRIELTLEWLKTANSHEVRSEYGYILERGKQRELVDEKLEYREIYKSMDFQPNSIDFVKTYDNYKRKWGPIKKWVPEVIAGKSFGVPIIRMADTVVSAPFDRQSVKGLRECLECEIGNISSLGQKSFYTKSDREKIPLLADSIILSIVGYRKTGRLPHVYDELITGFELVCGWVGDGKNINPGEIIEALDVENIKTLIYSPDLKIDQLNREREQWITRDQEKAQAEKLQDDIATQLRYYRKALENQHILLGLSVINKFGDIEDGVPHLIDISITRNKWTALEKIANSLIITEIDGESEKEPVSIDSLFESCTGISVILPGKFMAAYRGNHHGGSTEYYIENSNGIDDYLNALHASNNLDALIKGFYVALELPKKGAFWHGLYGRDYNFIFNNDQLIRFLKSRSTKPTDGKEIDRVGRPAGLRVIKSGDEYCVSCLAFYPDGSIKDLSILIKGGQIEICPDVEIMDATSQILY
jgi:hypothetical protein